MTTCGEHSKEFTPQDTGLLRRLAGIESVSRMGMEGCCAVRFAQANSAALLWLCEHIVGLLGATKNPMGLWESNVLVH